jgi:UDP-N-acetylmuramoyl-L-alanyl-D-glutamate--2,6-diaminopimelate ligase
LGTRRGYAPCVCPIFDLEMFWNEFVSFLPEYLAQDAARLPPISVPIIGITHDSRRVLPGYIFVALTGGTTDGHRYIPDALQRGAILVVGEKPLGKIRVPYLQVADSRLSLAHLSAAFYGLPARRLTVIGVTGTDGKTTTTNLIYYILLAAGVRAGMISTVNAVIGERVLDTGFHVTTPEAPDVQNYLAQMVAAGITHVVLEATSHGLAQHRVAACEFDLGVMTNITHEHLDYHGTFEAYREAKARLFKGLAGTPYKPQGNYRLGVLNRDDSSYDYLASRLQSHISYGLHPLSDLRAARIDNRPDGLHFIAVGHGHELPVSTHLIGEYNVSNCLAAAATTILGLGLDPQAAISGIANLPSVPGRMERIIMGQDFLAIVDFAHTPNALKAAESAVKSLAGQNGRVIAVFGSAGLRDRAKRHMMAKLSAKLADFTVLTAEDPRNESLDDILAEMAAGAAAGGGAEGHTFWRVPDRGTAIRFAVRMARSGDVVIVMGKGHEQSMCFGETEYPWDDRVAMRAALADYLGISAPPMPYLPTQS